MRRQWSGVAGLLLLAACGGGEEAADAENLAEQDWEEITDAADGAEIGIYMWGGDEGVNAYIDEIVAPELDETYGITLTRYPMEAPEFLSRLRTEREAGSMDGTADILWINGENFRIAKENELLYGSFAELLPNKEAYVNEEAPYVEVDMGTPVEGMQVPWGNVQYAFQFRGDVEPPATMEELLGWAEENPGSFTYPNVSNDTGAGFVRHVMHYVADDPADLETYDEDWIAENGEDVWRILRDLQPHLWREGQTYPETLEQQDQLFSSGEIDVTLGFNEHRAESLIDQGTFPEDTQTIGLASGSIASTHYLSIPFNTTEPEAALTAVNYLLSPEAQTAKLDPERWGEGHILELEALSEEEREAVESLSGEEVVPQEMILPELDARYVDWIQQNWEQEVVQQR